MKETKRVIQSNNLVDLLGLGYSREEAHLLQAIAKRLHHLHECECNYGLTPYQEARKCTLSKQIDYVNRGHPAKTVVTQGAPRGWPHPQRWAAMPRDEARGGEAVNTVKVLQIGDGIVKDAVIQPCSIEGLSPSVWWPEHLKRDGGFPANRQCDGVMLSAESPSLTEYALYDAGRERQAEVVRDRITVIQAELSRTQQELLNLYRVLVVNNLAPLLATARAGRDALYAAQGEWAAVTPTYAPMWTHPLKEAAETLDTAIAAAVEVS